MKTKLKGGILAMCILVLTALSYGQSYKQRVSHEYQDGKIIFQIKENALVFIPADSKGDVNVKNVPFLAVLEDKYGIARVTQKHPKSGSIALRKTYEVQFKNINLADSLVASLKQLSFIKYAEKKVMRHLFFTPNDSIYPNQWHLPKISAPAAWNITKGNSSVVVADVDNAILITHPDLAAHISPKSYDVADNDNDPSPPAASMSWDHGTHTCGIIGASTNNTIGVSSIGFGVTVMAVKVTPNNAGDPEQIEVEVGMEGIIYAADSGARVISCSWGGPTPSSYDTAAVEYAIDKGCIIVAAAGNSTSSAPNYPAGYPHVIAVASTGESDVLSSFSNYGSWITVCAPGENIWSTITDHNGASSGIPHYDYFSGTSMATPMVAGLCGLMLSENPSLSQSQLLHCLTSSCDNINASNPGNTENIGAGRINAQAALTCAMGVSTPPVADFVASTLLINPGGNVNFTDLSTNHPVSWAWRFPGSTIGKSTSQNPGGVTYNNVGVYPVTLSVTNSSGTDSVTKTAYINVENGNVIQYCDTVSNIPLPLTGSELTIYTCFSSGVSWGYVTGSNSYGDEANCDLFSAPPAGYLINGAMFYFARAYAGAPGHTISVCIWDNAQGFPTNLIAKKIVPINTLSTLDLSVINFDVPVYVPGPFYLGVQFDTQNSPLDTIVLVSSINSTSRPATAWCRFNTGIWLSDSVAWSDASISQAIFPIYCQGEINTTGIKEQSSGSPMSVFPNPTTGELTISYSTPAVEENLTVSVYNALGALVASADKSALQAGMIKLNLAGESPGIYFIESRTSAGIEYKKIVLTR